jgi:hypothetical protein
VVNQWFRDAIKMHSLNALGEKFGMKRLLYGAEPVSGAARYCLRCGRSGERNTAPNFSHASTYHEIQSNE